MIISQIHKEARDYFTVLNLKNEGVSGINPDEFKVSLYGPSGSMSHLMTTITELGQGHYRVSFTPVQIGLWYMVVSHAQHFPGGKAGSFQVFKEDFNTISETLHLIKDFETGRWKIDTATNEMLFYKEDNTNLIAKFKLFNESGNPSYQDVFERRRI